MIQLSEDAKKVGVAIGKVVVDVANLQFGEAIKNSLEAVAAYRHPDAPPLGAEDGACLLLQRAAVNAVMAAFQRHRDDAPTCVNEEEIATALAINPPRLNLNADDIAAPESWPARAELQRVFDACLTGCRMKPAARQPFLAAFDEEFPLALRREFLDRPDDYAELVRALQVKTPVDEAAKRGAEWRDYRARLAGAATEPMRSIDKTRIPRLSLQAMYVPLRAVWEEKTGGPKHIVWLDRALRDWVDAAAPDDWVRVVTGGPGYGKSSVCKILAADLARAGRRALLIPLGRLDYHGRAEDALRDWCRDKLGHNPLEPRLLTGAPLVLILDGLDELVKVGQIGEQAVGGFITDLTSLVERRNQDGLRVLLLLAGRPGAAAAAERLTRPHPGAWLEAQKFVIEGDSLFGSYGDYDDAELAKLDQRDEWWRRYGRNGLPDTLTGKDDRLDDATAQPLLNWLLAQVLTLEGEDAAIASVHQLYEKLLHHVLARSHRSKGVNEAIDKLDEPTLAALLEEVAAAAWHDGDRSVRLTTLQQRLTDDAHQAALKQLCEEKQELAIFAVLDSFFCTPRGGMGEARVFEFTHKSFREFLTARRLLREMTAIVDDRNGRKWRDNALEGWFDLCGPTAISRDLLTSLRDAAAAASEENLRAWRDAARELLNHTSHHGFALPTKGDWTTKELDRQARNAEEALLALHSACAMALQQRFPDQSQPRVLDWKPGYDGVAAGQWVHRIIGCRADRPVAVLCLNYCNLYRANLSDANLSDANLFGANLYASNIYGANLCGSNLSNTMIRDANICCANISDANISDANISRTNLSGANFHGSNLSGANIRGTNLYRADLSNANLFAADIYRANLNNTNLSGAKLDNVRGVSKEELADLRRRAAGEEAVASEEEEGAE